MQLFPRLMFDGVRVALQPVHVPLQLSILTLQFLHLLVQRTHYLTLVLVDRQTVCAENNVISNSQGQRCRGDCSSLPSSN